MKKILSFLTLAAMALTACQPKEQAEIRQGDWISVDFYAGQPATRTYIEEAQGGWQPYWSEQDSIVLTPASDLSKAYTFINTSGAGLTGHFSGKIESGDGEQTLYAYHPKKSNRSNDTFKFEIGTDQTLPSLKTFDPRYDLLVAEPITLTISDQKVSTGGTLSFSRIVSVVRILVNDATTSSALAGKAIRTVKFAVPGVTLCGELGVTISTGEIVKWYGDKVACTDYVMGTYDGKDWIAGSQDGAFLLVGPASIANGGTIKLSVTTSDGQTITATRKTSSAIAMESGKIVTLRFNITDKDLEPEEEEGLKPVTETTSWASTFTKALGEYGAGTEVTASFIMDNLSFLTGGGKFKFGTDAGSNRVQLGGTGSPGTKTCLQFMADGSGRLVANARSSGEGARPLAVAVGTSEAGRQDVPGKASDIATVSFDITAQSGDIINVYSGSSAINVYDLKWIPGGSSDDPGDPDEPGTPAESADLECTNPPATGSVELDKLYGYAEAKGVTGGDGGSVLHFNNGKALQTWLLARTKSEKAGDHSPVTIWLSGTFVPTDGRDFSEAHPWFDVKDVSNLSFYGTDGFVMDRIGIFCVRAKNIIIRNINFQQPKANNGADAVSMQECDGVWVDHCTFTSLNQTKDYEDGSTDITHGSKNVTVSWCRYIKTQKSCLVGHSNSQSGDASITATFHHNWFDGSSSRHPRVRFGTVHVYNNLFDGCTTYGVGSAYGAKVLVEYNYFDGVQLPTDICTYPAKDGGVSNLQGSVAGYLYPTENVYVNRPAKAKDPYPLSNVMYTAYNGSTITPLTYSDFKPAYSYTVTAAEDVPAVVKAGAGYGTLGWTEALVAVDNGGITEFNGSGDDPVDPDPDEPEDPVTPGDSAPHTHVFYYNSSSAAQNLTDGKAGSYFTATAKTDLSSDYCQDFNPWTINGYTSSKGVKLNSSGSVTFTTSSTLNSTVEFWFIRRKSGDTTARIQIVPDGGTPQVFDTPYDTLGDSGELSLEKGTAYTIKQDNKEQALLLVIVKETE